SHNRHWLDANGSEWRNQLQIGQVPRWFTELYHPLNWTMGASNDWFLAGYGLVERRQVAVYNNDSGAERGRFDRGLGRIGIDLGQPWAAFGEVRIGLVHEVERSSPDILALEYTGPRESQTVRETGLRMGVVLDQLDFANFPRRGYRVEAETVTGRHEDTLAPGSSRFTRLEAQASTVSSWGPHTLNAYARVQSAGSSALTGLGRYTLGGFHELSGYRPGQIDGNSVLFGRLTYYLHPTPAPLLTRGFFVGGTLEAGNAWGRWRDVSLADLRSGMSLFVGSDTGLGPLYLGLTYAPRGAAGLYLFIGRP
ncbi:MAG TPA: BamA/TamA family outer membrane protein, partial [Albitalea sp.]|nr:BamA/TamA family outer membrane protein [Albitalea sp.]